MKNSNYFKEPITCDFLVIGTGLSGLYAALYASNFGSVCIITKSSVEESNSYWAQGGIAAAIDRKDSVDSHYEDTISAGAELNDSEAVNIMVQEGFDRVKELVKMGMVFDSDSSGFDLGIEGGQLFSDSKECYGCLVQSDKIKKKIVINSKSTILATGGACGIYYNSTNPSATSGDGIIMGINAGATVVDMEFVQFHPTVFFKDGAKNFLISEALRGEGAKLINHSGKQFMKNYTPKKELASRDIVSKAIFNEMKTNGEKNVFLTLKHLDKNLIKTRFKNTYELCLREGVDITNEKIPVAPAAHYLIGGIKTDIYARTNIKNLYACGEVACSGAHGANRLASNSLLECLVFSKRAIDSALEFSRKIKRIPKKILKTSEQISLIPSEKKLEKYLNLRMSISQIINNHVGILRNKKDLLLALDEISSIKKKDLDKNDIIDNRILNLKTLSYLMTKSALLREESRGCHMREDFSSKNNKWLKHINWKISSGTLRFSYTNH